MPKKRVNGVELFHELHGTAGDPLVLVHGSWGDHHNWDAVVGGLSRTFRVLTYDRRGHSDSERVTGQGSVWEDVDDLAALIRDLGLAPAHIVGNSFGAGITLRLATKHAELFRTLIAHEPPLPALLVTDPAMQPLLSEVKRRLDAVAERIASGDAQGAAHFFVDEVALGRGAWDQLPPAMRQTFIRNAPTFLDERRDNEADRIDVRSLAKFTRPALLSRGDQSPEMFGRILDVIAGSMPHAIQKTFVGAGHVPHVTHPSAFVDVVKAFVAGATGATASSAV